MSDSTIRIKHKRSDIWEELVDEHSIFDTYIDMFVFTGCVGYYNNEYAVDFKSDNDDENGEILWMHLSNKDLFRASMAAIAYQHTGDPEALVQPKTQLQVMAQFAVGGAQIIRDELSSVKGDPTDTLINYIQNHYDPDQQKEQESELNRILKSFDSDMMDMESD